MTVTALGSLSLSVAVPGAAAGAAAGFAGINAALPDIEARIAALASFAPTPGNLLNDLALAQAIIAAIETAIAEGLTPPTLGAQIAIVAGILADLEALAVSINANLTIVTGLISLLATAGVDAYAFDGARNVLGSELATTLGGATTHANALVLLTTVGATWTAMQSLFKTS